MAILIASHKNYVDIQRDLGCVPGDPDAGENNADALNDYISRIGTTAAFDKPLFIPSGTFAISAPLVCPPKWGGAIHGVAGYAFERPESHRYDGQGVVGIGQMSQLSWTGEAGATMIELQGSCWTLTGFQLSGFYHANVVDPYPDFEDLAGVGIDVRKTSAGLGTGLHHIDVAIRDCQTGVEFSFDAGYENNSDQCFFPRLVLKHCRTGILCTNAQSIGHYVANLGWYPRFASGNVMFDYAESGSIAVGMCNVGGPGIMVRTNVTSDNALGFTFGYVKVDNYASSTIHEHDSNIPITDGFKFLVMDDSSKPIWFRAHGELGDVVLEQDGTEMVQAGGAGEHSIKLDFLRLPSALNTYKMFL